MSIRAKKSSSQSSFVFLLLFLELQGEPIFQSNYEIIKIFATQLISRHRMHESLVAEFILKNRALKTEA